MNVRGARRGLTLIEVAIAASILSFMLVSLSVTYLPVERATRHSSTALDMDQTARRVLDPMRRELRTSGSKRDGTRQVRVSDDAGPTPDGTAGDVIAFRQRIGPEDTDGTADGWSTPITYRAMSDGAFADGTPRLRLVREQGGEAVGIGRGLTAVRFTRVAGGETVIVELEIRRAGLEANAPRVRAFADEIQFLNSGA